MSDVWFACPHCLQPLSTKAIQSTECFCSDHPVMPIEMTAECLRELEKTNHAVQNDRDLVFNEFAEEMALKHYSGE